MNLFLVIAVVLDDEKKSSSFIVRHDNEYRAMDLVKEKKPMFDRLSASQILDCVALPNEPKILCVGPPIRSDGL